MNRKDFRPTDNSSSINTKDREFIQKNRKHKIQYKLKYSDGSSEIIKDKNIDNARNTGLDYAKDNRTNLQSVERVNTPKDRYYTKDNVGIGDYVRISPKGKDIPRHNGRLGIVEKKYTGENDYDYYVNIDGTKYAYAKEDLVKLDKTSENVSPKFTPSQDSDLLKHPSEDKYYVRTTDNKGNLVYAMNVYSFSSSPYYMNKKEATKLKIDLKKDKGSLIEEKPYSEQYKYSKVQNK